MTTGEKLHERKERALNLLKTKVIEHNNAVAEDKKWLSAELYGICQALFLCNIISAADWISIDELIKRTVVHNRSNY